MDFAACAGRSLFQNREDFRRKDAAPQNGIGRKDLLRPGLFHHIIKLFQPALAGIIFGGRHDAIFAYLIFGYGLDADNGGVYLFIGVD